MKNDKRPFVPPRVHTDYDLWEPPAGHAERFRIKLQKRPVQRHFRPDYSRWFVAAALLFLVLTVWLTRPSFLFPGMPEKALSGMETAKNQLEQIIEKEIIQWNAEEIPESHKIIKDAFDRLDRLESDFARLRDDFNHNQNSRVIRAMIRNLQMQTRILEDLETQLEELKKRQIHEKKVYHS